MLARDGCFAIPCGYPCGIEHMIESQHILGPGTQVLPVVLQKLDG